MNPCSERRDDQIATATCRCGVYFDGPCTPITAIACSDNAGGCGVTSDLTLAVVESITYLVRVGSPSPDEEGTGTLTI